MAQNKIYSFVVLTQGDGKPGELGFENLFTTRDPAVKEELARTLLERHAGFRRSAQTRNRREVIVTHVDKEEAVRWLTEKGRNGLTAKPVERGHQFGSATEASGHIGLRHNEVAMMLSRCHATGEKVCTVRGVTFAYADDVKK
jgi:hypothetical protein